MALEWLFNFGTLSAIVFILLIVFWLWKDRVNIERHGIIFIRRTERGINLLQRIAGRSPRFWKVLSTIGVVAGFSMSIFTFFFLVGNIINKFISTQVVSGLTLVLPTFSSEFTLLPGIFLTPFWYWIIAIFVIIVVHEGFHGIVGLVEKFKLNSVGWVVFGILPGAFVEPEGEKNIHSKKDEKKEIQVEGGWHGGSLLSRLRVIAAGSFGNFVLAALLFLVIFGITTDAHGGSEIRGLYDYQGVRVMQVVNGSPAFFGGLSSNVSIIEVNGFHIRDRTDFLAVLSLSSSSQTISLVDSNGARYSFESAGYPKEISSYPAKVRDYVFAFLEPIVPVHSFLSQGEHPISQLSRWNWIKDNFAFLESRAQDKIDLIEQELSSMAYIGVFVANEVTIKESVVPFFSLIIIGFQLLTFVMAISLGIGMANLLPVKPLDGGLLWDDWLRHKFADKGQIISRILSWTTFILILASLGINFI